MSKEDGNNRLWMTVNLSDSSGKRISHSLEYDDGVAWDQVLKDFVNALHGYGYVGVDERIFIQKPYTIGDGNIVLLQDIPPYLEEDHE
jgi:hypothetical protein